MNDAPIGTYVPPKNYSLVPDGLYPAHVKDAYVLMACCSPKKCLHTHTMENPVIPEIDKWGKSRVAVRFELDDEVGPDNGPISINRYFSISYGATGGTYAAFATFLQAVTGIKCGDKAQRNVKPSEIIGKPLQVLTANVEKDDTTRTNITGTLPPKKQTAPATFNPAAAPKPVQTAAEKLGVDGDDGLNLEDLPF